MTRTSLLASIAAGLLMAQPAAAEQRALSIDLSFHPERRVDFSGTPVTAITWLDANSYVLPARSSEGVEWQKIDAVSGRTSPLFDSTKMERTLAKTPGVSGEQASRLPRSRDLSFNATMTAALLTMADDL